MKTTIKIFLLLYFFSSFSFQKEYNKFKNPSPLIEFVHFKTDGMELKLSIKGIKYVQKDIKFNSLTIAKLVKKIHNKMVGGSSKMEINCIASQVYWHTLFYDVNKSPKSTSVNTKRLNRLKKIIPFKKIRNKLKKFSNDSANPINTSYTELYLRGCRQIGLYVVIPNVFKK